MKKEIKKSATDNLIYIHIVREDRPYVTRQRSHDCKWDGDDICHTHSIDGFEVVEKESGGWDFVLDENPEGNWYLVCAYYSSGDSFHREENCLTLISFVKHLEDAKSILKALENDYKSFRDTDDWQRKPISVHLPIANKIEEVYTGTWKGYFERLNSFEIETLTDSSDMKVVFN